MLHENEYGGAMSMDTYNRYYRGTKEDPGPPQAALSYRPELPDQRERLLASPENKDPESEPVQVKLNLLKLVSCPLSTLTSNLPVSKEKIGTA